MNHKDSRMLFTSAALAGTRLKNRVAMAPMTRSRALDDGTPTPLMTEYYAQRAGAGMIVTEGTSVSAQGQGFLNVPGIFSEAHVAAWRDIVQAVHAQDSKLFMQLWHVGRIGHPDNMLGGLHPVAPSAIAHERTIVTRAGLKPAPVPRELTLEEIRAIVRDFGAAAQRAVAAGCDGVEIHAANGYLPSQFLHETSNLRTDAYGGSIENRARFLIEAAQACADAIGAHRVGVRLTPFSVFNGAQSPDDAPVYAYLVPALARIGLGFLHVVGAEVSGNQTVRRAEGESAPDVLGFVRPLWPRALVAAGAYDAARAEADLRAGRADVIAFGRDFIGNPDLVERMLHGHPLTERNPAEWYGPAAQGYTDYPRWTGAHATTTSTADQ
jgi:N-ethylmaleimide reductase